MEGKLSIYYKPSNCNYEYVHSFTLSFSRINEIDGFYKKKATLEHKSSNRNRIEEYKIREMHTDTKDLIRKIHRINFNKFYPKPIEGQDYFFITFQGQSIQTSDKESIQYILDMFNFDKLVSISHKHYQYIKDMDEYTRLVEILNSKLSKLSGSQIVQISHLFKSGNPYELFQNMSWLETYLKTE